MRAISLGSDVLTSAGCRRMRDSCGERLPAAVQPFSRQFFDKTQSPVGTRFESTTGDLLFAHRAMIFCAAVHSQIFATTFCTTDHSRLFVITETKNTTWRIRSLPSGSAGPSRRPEAWKTFRGAPQILISRALETRSSKKGPPEPGGPLPSKEPAHQPKRI